MGDRYDQGRVLILGGGSSLRHITKTETWKRNQGRDLVIHRAESKLSSQLLNLQEAEVYELGQN